MTLHVRARALPLAKNKTVAFALGSVLATCTFNAHAMLGGSAVQVG